MLPHTLVVVSRTSPIVSIRSVRDLFLNSPEILMPNISSSLSNTFPSANDSPLVSIGCSICAKVVWVSVAPAIRPWLTSINYDTLMHVIALRNASRAPLDHQRLTRYAIMSFSDGFLLCCFLRTSTFSVCYPLLMCVGGRSFYTSVNLDQLFSIGGFQIHRAAASLQIYRSKIKYMVILLGCLFGLQLVRLLIILWKFKRCL